MASCVSGSLELNYLHSCRGVYFLLASIGFLGKNEEKEGRGKEKKGRRKEKREGEKKRGKEKGKIGKGKEKFNKKNRIRC